MVRKESWTMKNEHGYGQKERFPVGTVVLRKRHKRNEPARAYIKVASPSEWVLLARFRWGEAFGPIPAGMGVHHKDGDRANDALDNLELVSKAGHLATHRPEFQKRALAGFIAARRRLRWSTKAKGPDRRSKAAQTLSATADFPPK